MSTTAPWYAVRVKSRREKQVAASLSGRGFECFLPLYKNTRTYSYRKSNVESELPLFPGYVFSQVDWSHRLPLLQTPGFVNIVCAGIVPAPVDEAEIAAIRLILDAKVAADPWPFLETGQRIRIEYGALKGLEGLLTNIKGNCRIVVSVTLLQRSVAVEVDRGWITPIGGPKREDPSCPPSTKTGTG